MPHVVVSYDGTRNDRDALALGQLFAAAGADVSLAYVRHARESEPAREAAVQEEAEHMLAVGARQLNSAAVGQRVVVNPSTARGLAELATELGADAIAFGSSYRTPEGQVALPHTAQQLLDGGTAAWSLALAPAGLRREPVERSIGTVRVEGDGDDAATATAQSLAHALGAAVTDDDADLLVIPSRSDAPPGRLLLSAPGRERLDQARCPVLALPRGKTLTFG